MTESKLARITVWIAALFVALVSEFFPIAGLLAFPEGFHSGGRNAFLVVVLCLNFAIFFASTFFLFRFLLRKTIRPEIKSPLSEETTNDL
jgi:hypothetical protein